MCTSLHRLPLFLLTLTFGVLAHAAPDVPDAPDAPEPERTPVIDGDRCPQLFGTPKIQARNKARRERALLWAEAEEGGLIDVTHTTSWKRPRRVIFPGVEVLETHADEAIIELGPEQSDHCPPGRYRVHVDDALGRGNRVLAVVGDVMLLESGSRLLWLAEPDRVAQDWRMVWASWWKQPAPRMANPVTVITGNSKTNARNRRNARNRNRNRNKNRRGRR